MNADRRTHHDSDDFSPHWAQHWVASEKDWRLEFTPHFYYEQLRKEIEREDGITNQRLTWSMSLQGFLIASMTFLLSGAWPIAHALPLEYRGLRLLLFRELALGAIGLVGIAVAYVTYKGVGASRSSISRVKEQWTEYNEILRIVPSMAPQTYGHGATFPSGTSYAVFIPQVLLALWAAYLATYLAVLGPLVWAHVLAL
jgi:hypothetical protein